MSGYKISIVTPSFNQGQYLEQTIDSIIKQDYPDKELIIVDGGSTDNSVEIIKKYEKHLAWWVSEPDQGQAHAINKGLAYVKGDIFNWINSDDYLESGALSSIATVFKDNSSAQVVCGYTHCFYNETGDTSHTYRMGLKKDPTTTLLNVEMNQPGTFYKTDVIKKLGGINESMQYVMDDELWMRFLCRHGQEGVALVNTLIAHFRLHGSSKSIGDGFEGFINERKAVLYQLSKQTEISDYLYLLMKREIVQESKYVTDYWELNHLNIPKLHAWFANRYMVSLYNENLKKEAKECLYSALSESTFEWNRKNLGLAKKLFLFD